jgi:membrane protease YdiL (CAAX protease family)
MKKNISFYYDLAELFVLLMLPLPFLHLNLIYVIAAVIIILVSRWLRKEDWSSYGFLKVHFQPAIIASVIGIGFGFADNYLIEPLITKLTGYTPDLSTYESIQGNWLEYIILLLIGWVVGGFFEEFFFRGYLFHRIGKLIKHAIWFRIVSITVTSIVFAFAHNYQGMGGIIGTFYFAVIMGILYFVFKRNVWYLVLIHGFYDMVGITKLFLGHN